MGAGAADVALAVGTQTPIGVDVPMCRSVMIARRSSWHREPRCGQPGHHRNGVEILVKVQDGQARKFCRGGDQKVGNGRPAMKASISQQNLDFERPRSSIFGVRYSTGIAARGDSAN